ncbi:MAG TPA: hypothetical protein VIH27_04890 [Nitrososphaerales archaeon]
MAIDGSIETTITISLIATLLGTMGFSLAFKDYIASLMAGLIIRRGKLIKNGGRVKILTSPIVKGDVRNIGWLRTTLMEVGDGERLPSVQTGRLMKIPNFMLFNNPTLIYGETLIDEVVAYVKSDLTRSNGKLIENMAHAIEAEGHKIIGIGLYQKENSLVVHGIFESTTKELADVRSKILARYLEMIRPELD